LKEEKKKDSLVSKKDEFLKQERGKWKWNGFIIQKN
jgi:hypothetical protein